MQYGIKINSRGKRSLICRWCQHHTADTAFLFKAHMQQIQVMGAYQHLGLEAQQHPGGTAYVDPTLETRKVRIGGSTAGLAKRNKAQQRGNKAQQSVAVAYTATLLSAGTFCSIGGHEDLTWKHRQNRHRRKRKTSGRSRHSHRAKKKLRI